MKEIQIKSPFLLRQMGKKTKKIKKKHQKTNKKNKKTTLSNRKDDVFWKKAAPKPPLKN